MKSRGYLAQGTYKFGPTKVGISYGENKDEKSVLCGGCDRKTPGATLGSPTPPERPSPTPSRRSPSPAVGSTVP